MSEQLIGGDALGLTNEQVESLRAEHKPAMLEMVDRWRHALQAAGFMVSEPCEMREQEYRWDLAVSRKGEDAFLELMVALAESREWDSSADADGSSEGIAVMSGILTASGRILAGLTPVDLSERMWADDADAVRHRVTSAIRVDSAAVVEFVSQAMTVTLADDRVWRTPPGGRA